MPWRSIYVLAPYICRKSLRDHELVHIKQMDRDGTFLFCLKYVFWLAKHGYEANPYEVEARRIAGA